VPRAEKALYELADKGQIDHFLKKGPRSLRREREPVQPQPRDEECSTEVVATIVEGYAETMTLSAWKAQLRGTEQVLTAEWGTRVTVSTMVFGRREAQRFASPHNDPLVVEMKVGSTIVRRILIDTRSFVDISRTGYYPLGAPYFRLWCAAGESHRHDSPPFTL